MGDGLFVSAWRARERNTVALAHDAILVVGGIAARRAACGWWGRCHVGGWDSKAMCPALDARSSFGVRRDV